jgi:hypothetical protein
MRRATIHKLAALAASGTCLLGCARAEKARYLAHARETVAVGLAPSDEVALAFGLDQFATVSASASFVDSSPVP